ncbi:hypothetical protein HK103_003775 [Boothiomyces macroporosus]|uniref:Uncharacterized protein n=1 Tax=Boothiomyces macroporosus TaxID=261099 RepID=A0AAD5Y4G8_9FUNG|nr:hypothetical protein HK103_003775 [Boothiomyces macroporosus]
MSRPVSTKPNTADGFKDFSENDLKPALPSKKTMQELVPEQYHSLRPVIDFQELAPSPNQTFYQLVVYPFQAVAKSRRNSKKKDEEDQPRAELNRDKALKGCVILRDWPRKRMSQQWRRDGMVNPGERVISFDDFVDGEMDAQLITVFGQERYDQALQAVKKEIEKRNKYGF